jgi:CHAT domain-containing protein/tetratricopeptide (TPR) repeat protein
MRKGALALSSLGLAMLLGAMVFRSDASAVDDRPVTREELFSLLHGIRVTEGVLLEATFTPREPRQEQASRFGEVIASPAFRQLYLRNARNLRNQPTSETLVNAAVIETVEGDLDSAIDLLTRAVRLDSSDEPALWNDLSALYLERARSRHQPYDMVLALAAAEKAARGGFWEARFNRALALKHLHLDPASRAEWKDLLDALPSPEWQEEAVAQWWSLRRSSEVTPIEPPDLLASFVLKGPEVVRDLVRDFPQKARSYGEEVLLGQWANRHEDDPEKARLTLRVVEAIGEELEAAHGDRMLLDSVRIIQSAEARGRASQLVVGHDKFSAGHAALKDGDCRSAQALLATSERALKAEGSPFARWANFYQAICSYFAQDFASAEAKVSELVGSGLEHYVTFEARLRWLQGLLRISQADSVGSLGAYLRSLDLFEKAEETGNVSAMSSLIAENLLRLGQKEASWKYRERALGLLREKGSTRTQTILDEASEAAFREGSYEMALYLQDEVVSLVNRAGTAHEIAEAYLRRIPIHVRLGRMEAAEADFSASIELAGRIPDEALQERLEADALLSIGEGRMAVNPAQALAGFDRVLSLYDSLGYRFRSVELRRLRALASEALGNGDQAEAELEVGVREIEEEVENLRDDLRETYLRQTVPLFDERIRVAAQNPGDVAQALLYSERARTLSLPATSSVWIDLNDPDLWLSMLQRRIPAGTLVVAFRVLEKETLVWSIGRRKFEFFIAHLGRERLDESLDGLIASATSKKKFQRESSFLFDQLVRPAMDGTCRRLVFVPDKGLWNVPFAALYNNLTKRYLVEDASIVVASSMSSLTLKIGHRSWTSRPSILAVGDPNFERKSFPSLARLPNARAEAESAALLYSSHERHLLLGEKATVENFVRSAPFQDILHFSGHAVEAEGLPLLLFAPDVMHTSGALTHLEIEKLDLSRTRLVVLAGCRTTRPFKRDGLALLSAAFITAGVQEVIGSLWKIEDNMGNGFFKELHRHIAAGETGEVALRKAQLSLLAEGVGLERLPMSWAGVQVVVGSPTAE